MDNPAAPIPSTSPQPAIEPEASTPSESSSRRWFLWSAGGLAILIFGIALGVFSAKFFSESKNQFQLTSTPTLTPLPSPAPPPDLYREPNGSAATADWKTFAFEPMSHIFKYPTDWTAAPCESGIYLFTHPIQRPGTSCDTPPFGVVSITFDNKPIETGYLKSTDYVLSDEQKVTTSFGQATKRIIKLVQVKEVPGPTNYFEITFKGTNGYYYLISTENSQYETVIDQILSTFKFLDKTVQ